MVTIWTSAWSWSVLSIHTLLPGIDWESQVSLVVSQTFTSGGVNVHTHLLINLCHTCFYSQAKFLWLVSTGKCFEQRNFPDLQYYCNNYSGKITWVSGFTELVHPHHPSSCSQFHQISLRSKEHLSVVALCFFGGMVRSMMDSYKPADGT